MPALTVFIDEAGDPGVKDGAKYADSRHEWFCVSAVVMRRSREAESVEWVRELLELGGVKQSRHLHYAKVKPERRLPICAALAEKPVKLFCVASNKTNVRAHRNQRLGRLDNSQVFYNWCTRLLMERVTGWAAAWTAEQNLPPEPLEVVFAERGGHSYRRMFQYFDKLRGQVATGKLILKGGGLSEPTLDRTYWRIDRAESIAGCQLADVTASAIYQAVNSKSPTWDPEPAIALKPRFAHDGRLAANIGLTVLPMPEQGAVPAEARPFLRQFGYRI